MANNLTAFLTFLISFAPAQDARRWAEAMSFYQKFSASRDPLERARSAEELGIATSGKYDRLCGTLVLALLRQELAREGAGGKTEEKLSGDVVEACLATMRKLTHKDAVADLLKIARAKGEHVRVRVYCLWALGPQGPVKELSDLVDEKLLLIQVAATDALAERGDAASVPVFLRLLKEPRTWEVKLAALKGLEKAGDDQVVEPLIDGLGACRADEGRLKDQYLVVLRKLAGLDLESDDPNAWTSAWAAKKAGGPLPQGATVVAPTQFYGLPTRSTRLVFVLDRTGSMAAPGSAPPRPLFTLPPDALMGAADAPHERAAREEATRIAKKWEAVEVKTRMDAAKKEFISTVYALSPRVYFNVVWYEGTPSPWRQELVPATWVNKVDCMKDADKLQPSGSTNIWDALELAFRMIEQPPPSSAFAIDKKVNYAAVVGGADTFYLMTDGCPTAGRIQKPADVLAEVRKVNRLRRVVLNTICVGDVPLNPAQILDGPDPAFLKRLADDNGGSFIHIRE